MKRPTSKDLARAIKHGKFIPAERPMTHQIAKYLKFAYPKVLWKYDYGADADLSPRQAKEQKDLSCIRGWPELHIWEQRHGYSGLILELKREDISIYNNLGMFKSTHLKEQNEMIQMLRDRGYCCFFSKGFDNTRALIDWYLTGSNSNPPK